MASGAVGYGAFQLLSRDPHLVERFYATGPGPALARALGTLSSGVPFPVAGVLLVGVPLVAVLLVALELRRARARGRAWPWGLLAGAFRLGGVAGVLVLLFYVVWGFNYARPPLEERLGWTGSSPPEAAELHALASEAVIAANGAYRALHGRDDAGIPTSPVPAAAREAALEVGWSAVAAALDGGGVPGWPGARVKTLGIPRILETLGIYGFYFPFTGEPIINGGLPGVVEATSAAHEQAHQRGVAPEDEASFLAFIVTTRSSHPGVRYAGWFYAQRRLLADLRGVDPQGARELAASRLPGVERDLRDLAEYLRRLQGPVNAVADRVNDAYLRSNRVEGGIRSYGMATRLLVGWARDRGGALGAAEEVRGQALGSGGGVQRSPASPASPDEAGRGRVEGSETAG
jgi:hypothetical protein